MRPSDRFREFLVFGVVLVGERHHSNDEANYEEANKPELVNFLQLYARVCKKITDIREIIYTIESYPGKFFLS